MSNSQLNELKSGIKNGTEVTLKLSSNVVGDSNDENNFSLRKTFGNGSSAKIKLLQTQLHKIGRSGGLFGRLLGLLLKTGLPLIGNVLKPLAKRVLMPLRLTATASATDAAIHKKMFRSGFTTLIISNKELNDIIKIVKSLEGSGLFIKGISKAVKNEQKGGFFGMLLDT